MSECSRCGAELEPGKNRLHFRETGPLCVGCCSRAITESRDGGFWCAFCGRHFAEVVDGDDRAYGHSDAEPGETCDHGGCEEPATREVYFSGDGGP